MTPFDWSMSLEDSTWISDADRRGAERDACGAVRPIRLLVKPSFRALPAFIRNFSRRGVGLIVMRPLDAGTMLAMQLRQRQAGVSGILTAHVCHVTSLNNKYWSIGCRLRRGLSEAESRALLRGHVDDEDY